ncbi:hypothetical protein DACRYDRAFT_112583 [Dacryopinax primogenitus]|uniref:F-box domain-containing protein n=1 Tax=Dacryopinax primogenitus (strain DJM 731) TaxID=1858805 RepID=M5FPY6_DACPD|nr:uncharacterized protein DACRYDRAFT_112583 [Dacryopinax primogenitus]EJT96634.1 hypothetical protein DACRYDRAFT_112583 [Dacryopinax primogenitus]
MEKTSSVGKLEALAGDLAFVKMETPSVPLSASLKHTNTGSSILSLPSELLRQVALEVRWQNIPVSFDPSRDDFTLSASKTRFNVNRFSLCSLLQTCRYISRCCDRVLYDAVEACMKNPAWGKHEMCGGSLPLLLRTLEHRPDLASVVRAVAFNLDGAANEWEESSSGRKAARRLLELCRNVHSIYCDTLPPGFLLEADVQGLRAAATTFRPELFGPCGTAYFSLLENLVIEDVYFTGASSFSRLALPKLKHLSLLRCLQQGATLLPSALSVPAEELEELFIHKLDDTSGHYLAFHHAQLYGSRLRSLTLCGWGLMHSINEAHAELWNLLPALSLLVISRDHVLKLVGVWVHMPSLQTLILADLDYGTPPFARTWRQLLEHELTRANVAPMPRSICLWERKQGMTFDISQTGNESFACGTREIPVSRGRGRHPRSTYETSTEVALDFTSNEDVIDLDIQYQSMAW